MTIFKRKSIIFLHAITIHRLLLIFQPMISGFAPSRKHLKLVLPKVQPVLIEELEYFYKYAKVKIMKSKKNLNSLVTKEYLDFKFNEFKQEIIELIRNTKNELFSKIDPILQEVVTSREEREVGSFQKN